MRTLRLDTTGKKQTPGLTNEASIVSGNHFRFPLRSLSDLKALEMHLSSSASAKDEIVSQRKPAGGNTFKLWVIICMIFNIDR